MNKKRNKKQEQENRTKTTIGIRNKKNYRNKKQEQEY